MDGNKARDPIPEEFQTIEAAAEFWDTHSLADYWDQTRPVEIQVAALRQRRVVIEPSLWEQVVAAARARSVLPETLVNLWLAEKVQIAHPA